MAKILFAPLNTNHVLIFSEIIRSLSADYCAICHDRIAEAAQYRTEDILREKQVAYRHFPEAVLRTPTDTISTKIVSFFRIRTQVRALLKQMSPRVIVLAMDNDPISLVLIDEAKRNGIKTVLIQEALIRPNDYEVKRVYRSDFGYKLLHALGLHLSYTVYGMSKCDAILVGGPIAYRILRSAGIPKKQLVIVGQPKYDDFIKQLKDVEPQSGRAKTFLFAASTTVIRDENNIRFLQEMARSAKRLGIFLTIKLHPRSVVEPQDVRRFIDPRDASSVEVVKGGDGTLESLKRSDALITVASTVAIEALMMDKECIVAHYLAGDARLGYDEYDALHDIWSESEIGETMKRVLVSRKNRENKARLLEDELYRLDGKAGLRAAQFVESLI